ncbi:iron ABC transporter substrate-binding protein, partial [Staphylococcus aureus]|nr:iron ABC transporter substrate-binding protein [Staphylococcus aureus]
AAFQKDAKAKYKDAWPLKASVVNFRADHTRIYAGGYAGEILKNLDAVKNNQVSDDLDEITWNLAGGYKSSLKLIDDLYEKLNIEKQSK